MGEPEEEEGEGELDLEEDVDKEYEDLIDQVRLEQHLVSML